MHALLVEGGVPRPLWARNTSSDSSRRADHVGVRRISRRCQLTALHQWHVLLCQDKANGSLAPLSKARSQSILTLRQRGEQPQVQRRAYDPPHLVVRALHLVVSMRCAPQQLLSTMLTAANCEVVGRSNGHTTVASDHAAAPRPRHLSASRSVSAESFPLHSVETDTAVASAPPSPLFLSPSAACR